MSKPLVIGFMGFAGVGKTTAATTLKTIAPNDIEVVSFAGPLKQAVQQLFLLEDHQLYGTKEQKETKDPRWGKSPRELLQIIGTDCLRDMVDSRFHVKRMDALLSEIQAKVVIIDDIRFPDEAALVNLCGVCFNIKRPGFPQEAVLHKSENPPEHLASGYYLLNNQDKDGFGRMLLQSQSYIRHLIEEELRK